MEEFILSEMEKLNEEINDSLSPIDAEEVIGEIESFLFEDKKEC